VLDRPILIGCAPSSGSTLLRSLLNAHPELASGPELSLLGHPGLYAQPWPAFRLELWRALQPWYFHTMDAAERLAAGFCPYSLISEDNLGFYGFRLEDLQATILEAEGPADFLQKLFSPLLERTGKRRWAEKTPSNLYALRAFLDCFPTAKAVYLVRNGLDQVCSLLKRGFGLKRAVALWMVETTVCESLRGHPRVFRLAYEELTAQPQAAMARLLDFLELSTDVEGLLVATNVSESGGPADATAAGLCAWRSRPSDPINTRSVDRWRQELDEDVLAICLASRFVCPPSGAEDVRGLTFGDMLRRSGYEAPASTARAITPRMRERLACDNFLAWGDDYLGSHLFQERYITSEPSGLQSHDAQSLRWESRFHIQRQTAYRTQRTLHEVSRLAMELAYEAERAKQRIAFLERPALVKVAKRVSALMRGGAPAKKRAAG